MTEVLHGRRERKKQATRCAIKDAALRLALERGVDDVTVEEITEAADVSPRTFFNYFSSKEEALVGEAAEAEQEIRDALARRPADEPALAMLRAVLTQTWGAHLDRAERETTLARQRLVRQNPSLLPRQLAKFAAVERTLAEAVAQRLGARQEDDTRPALLAALAVTVVRVAMQRWTVDGSRRPGELIDEGFGLLEPGP